METYIKQNGTDPITGQPLAIEDLIEIKSSHVARPRPASATSIPSLLTHFQSEFDSMALEVFSLRKQLLETKQELSSALYHNDAAVRVIARLTKERDEAREALSQLASSLGQNVPSQTAQDSEQTQAETFSLSYSPSIAETRNERVAARKQGAVKVSETWATKDDISALHQVSKTKQFFTSVSKAALISSDLILSGGGKSTAGIFSISAASVVHNFSLNGLATSFAATSNSVIVGLKTGEIQLFTKEDEEYSKNGVLVAAHGGAVRDIALLPYNDVIVSGGADGTCTFYDPATQQKSTLTTGASDITAVAVHPDGALLALGTEGTILVYNLAGEDIQDPAATFDTNGETVISLSFAENGKWLVSVAGTSGMASIWHLGKVDLLATVQFETFIDSSITRISFDRSSNFLLAAGPSGIEVAAHVKKEGWLSNVFSDSTPVSDALWGTEAKEIIGVSSKGNFYVYESSS